MTDHPFSIRAATGDDAALVYQFVRDLAVFDRLEHECVATEDMIARALSGPRPDAEVLLGFEGDSPAAFAVYFQNFSTFLGRPGIYLEDLFVRPAFRRRGYGKALLESLAREANRRGCGRFEWAVLDWNKNAIAFYESLGATVLPDWRVCRLTGDALTRYGV